MRDTEDLHDPTEEQAPMLAPHLGDMTALAREEERLARAVRTIAVLADACLAGGAHDH